MLGSALASDRYLDRVTRDIFLRSGVTLDAALRFHGFPDVSGVALGLSEARWARPLGVEVLTPGAGVGPRFPALYVDARPWHNFVGVGHGQIVLGRGRGMCICHGRQRKGDPGLNFGL